MQHRRMAWDLPAWIFAVACIVALPYLMYAGRAQWFYVDDFDFFADRHLTFTDLMQPHYGHWSTLPILEYRALYSLVGLREYWAYELVAVVGHLAVTVLLFVIMRRASVQPWIATASGLLFMFFGPGWADIIWSFQVGFTGGTAFGLTAILLVNHRQIDRKRYWLGLACGFAALLCSGVGVAMVCAGGVAVLIRRGWRAALAFTGPLLAVFLLWYATYGHKFSTPQPSPTEFRIFLWAIVSNPFGQLAHVRWLGWILGLVLAAGIVVAVKNLRPTTLKQRYAAISGLLFGMVVFAAMTSISRGYLATPGSDGAARASRYVYIGAVLLLPAITAAASLLAVRKPQLIVAAVVLLLVGLPGNAAQLHPWSLAVGSPRVLVAASQSPRLDEVPASLRLNLADTGGFVNAGWLREAKDQGKLPSLGVSEHDHQLATFALTFRLVDHPAAACHAIMAGSPITVLPSDVIDLPVGTTRIKLLSNGHAVADTSYRATGVFDDQYIKNVFGSVQAAFFPQPGSEPVGICESPTRPDRRYGLGPAHPPSRAKREAP